MGRGSFSGSGKNLKRALEGESRKACGYEGILGSFHKLSAMQK